MPVPGAGRSIKRWLLLWVLLTAFGVAIHMVAWHVGDGPPPRAAELPGVKVLANFNHMVSAPGWVLVNMLTGFWGYGTLGPVTASSAIGWGLVTACLFVLVRARRSLLHPADESVNLSRRRAIVNTATGVGVAVAGAGFAEAVVLEPTRLAVRRYSIPIRNLPAGFAGFRIVQISDTHLGPRISERYIGRAVELALSLEPSLLALTGDYIHTGAAYTDSAARLFVPLVESRIPVVGTLGNHDWYGGGRRTAAALAGVGVRMIDNARVFIDAGTRTLSDLGGRDSICIAGLGDLGEDSIRPDETLHGLPADMPRIVLAHNPDSAEETSVTRAGASRIDLMLSGHTHGGQIYVPGVGTPFLPSRYGQKYAGGVCKGPRFPVVVSRGVGMSIFPVRIGVPPEIVVVELRPA